jgi:hypothetical protein
MPETLLQPLTISAPHRRTAAPAPADAQTSRPSRGDSALSTQHSALPPDSLSPEDQEELLALYTHANLTVFDIAARFSLRAADVRAWYRREDIRQRLAELVEFSTERALNTAAIQQTKCIAVFKSVLDAHLDEEANIPVAPNTESRRLRHDQRTLAVRVAATLLRLARTRVPSVAAVTSPGKLDSATQRRSDLNGPADSLPLKPSPDDQALSTQHAAPLSATLPLCHFATSALSIPAIAPLSPFTCTNGHFESRPTPPGTIACTLRNAPSAIGVAHVRAVVSSSPAPANSLPAAIPAETPDPPELPAARPPAPPPRSKGPSATGVVAGSASLPRAAHTPEPRTEFAPPQPPPERPPMPPPPPPGG